MHCFAMRAVLAQARTGVARVNITEMGAHYHCSVKMIGRSDGRSAVACAAYRSGERLHDERYAKEHNYAPRRGVTQTGILAPKDAPQWAFNREALWNRAEAVEKRKDAQVAREFELALPHQVSADVRVALVEEFISQELIPRGMIVDYAIHSPNGRGDDRNWHAHLMTTLRPLEAGDFSRMKDRDACTQEMVCHWRQAWAELQNRTFERLKVRGEDGGILRADHRSYEEQGIGQEPTLHMGVLATAMERHGIPTEIGELNREIVAANAGIPIRRHTQAMGRGQILTQISPPPDAIAQFNEALEAELRRVRDERGFEL